MTTFLQLIAELGAVDSTTEIEVEGLLEGIELTVELKLAMACSQDLTSYAQPLDTPALAHCTEPSQGTHQVCTL